MTLKKRKSTNTKKIFNIKPSINLFRKIRKNKVKEGNEINYAEEYNSAKIELQLGSKLLDLVVDEDYDILSKMGYIRKRVLKKKGFLVPTVNIVDNIKLPAYEYRILINGLTVGKYEVEPDKYLVVNPLGVEIVVEGIEGIEPISGSKTKWIDQEQLNIAEQNGYMAVDGITVLLNHLESLAITHAHEILTRELTRTLIEYVEEKNPTIVNEVIPNILTLGEIQAILENLLREDVSIKNLNLILEALSDNKCKGEDIATLTNLVRVKLRKEIISSLEQENDIYYIDFTKESNLLLIKSLKSNAFNDTYISLDADIERSLFNQLIKLSEAAVDKNKIPVLVCELSTRFYLAKYIGSQIPVIKVLSDEELTIPGLETTHIGSINLCS